MGGLPHNGKMYGFYDPTDAPVLIQRQDRSTRTFWPSSAGIVVVVNTSQAPGRAQQESLLSSRVLLALYWAVGSDGT